MNNEKQKIILEVLTEILRQENIKKPVSSKRIKTFYSEDYEINEFFIKKYEDYYLEDDGIISLKKFKDIINNRIIPTYSELESCFSIVNLELDSELIKIVMKSLKNLEMLKKQENK